MAAKHRTVLKQNKPARTKRTKIRYVNGFHIRNTFPDFDLVETAETLRSHAHRPGASPHIPPGETWVDARFKYEARFLLEANRLNGALPRLSYPEFREHLKKTLTKKGDIPDLVVRTVRHGKTIVRYVRGDLVRSWIDPHFIFGGHDLVYDYIPKNEIWIDQRQDPKEIPFTLMHELEERKRMRKGYSYDVAHHKATNLELYARWKSDDERRGNPLRLTPHRQRPGYCGPACLKIATALFGRIYDETYLGKLCRTTPGYGTDHADLIRAAKTLGATVTVRADASIAYLRHYVCTRRLPVIVGWYSPDKPGKTDFDPARDEYEDHFSVVANVTDTHVHMIDPQIDSGRKRLTIERFKKLWWDTDGPKNRIIKGWCLVIDFG